jgi:uncharacterized protein DUF5522
LKHGTRNTEHGTKPGPLVEGVDFYQEGPYVVFTEKYLRERGYCCESGCRHCPYGKAEDRRQTAEVDKG